MNRTRTWWDVSFFVEIILLLLAAPALFQPASFPRWVSYASLALLLGTWLWRRWRLGSWRPATAADLPLFFLFAVMLPISLWAAPEPLRRAYSIPKAYTLLWSFTLFWLVVAHGRRSPRLRSLLRYGFLLAGMAVAAVSLVSAKFPTKLPVLQALLDHLPPERILVLQGAERGINANQVGGSLLYVLPVALALAVACLKGRRPGWRALLLWLMVAAMGLVFAAAQSRFSLLGMAAALLFMVLFPWRWGRWGLLFGGAGLLVSLPYLPWASLLDIAGEAEALGSISLAGRVEIWSRALYGIQDFPFTGMGLGTFRQIVHLLYPLFTIAPNVDIAHAHNFFLQTALDFGLPGLLALLAILFLAARQALARWQEANDPNERAFALGSMAALLGASLYGLGDAVAMGARPNFLFWYLLALIFATPGHRPRASAQAAASQPAPSTNATIYSGPSSPAPEQAEGRFEQVAGDV